MASTVATGIDTEVLDLLGTRLTDAASAISDATSVAVIRDALDDVREAIEVDGPEWIAQARARLSELREALEV
jgi:hypothetical protein